MDYILATFAAVMSAVVYSAVALWLAASSRRPAYRKFMWAYVLVLFVAAVATMTRDLPIAYLAVGSLFSGIFGFFAQLAVAVKLGHIREITPSDCARRKIDRFDGQTRSNVDIRDSRGPVYNGRYDPLRHW